MARGSLWLLIGSGLCLAVAVSATAAPETGSTQSTSTQSPPNTTASTQSFGNTSGDTSPAPTGSTAASAQTGATSAAPVSSGNPEPASASSPPPSAASPGHDSSGTPSAPSANGTRWTEQPEPPNSTTASSSTSVPGSGPTLQTTEAAPSLESPSLSQSPGLVAVICIFVAILGIGAGVVLSKLCHRREPAFKKLEEVPMGKMTEDAPFARYPPK